MSRERKLLQELRESIYGRGLELSFARWIEKIDAILLQPEADDMTNTDKSNLGRWKDDGVDTHKGDYYYKCSVCGASDCIARYGTLDQLRCKCNETATQQHTASLAAVARHKGETPETDALMHRIINGGSIDRDVLDEFRAIERQRDELRAEVEHLRAQIEMLT